MSTTTHNYFNKRGWSPLELPSKFWSKYTIHFLLCWSGCYTTRSYLANALESLNCKIIPDIFSAIVKSWKSVSNRALKHLESVLEVLWSRMNALHNIFQLFVHKVICFVFLLWWKGGPENWASNIKVDWCVWTLSQKDAQRVFGSGGLLNPWPLNLFCGVKAQFFFRVWTLTPPPTHTHLLDFGIHTGQEVKQIVTIQRLQPQTKAIIWPWGQDHFDHTSAGVAGAFLPELLPTGAARWRSSGQPTD